MRSGPGLQIRRGWRALKNQVCAQHCKLKSDCCERWRWPACVSYPSSLCMCVSCRCSRGRYGDDASGQGEIFCAAVGRQLRSALAPTQEQTG